MQSLFQFREVHQDKELLGECTLLFPIRSLPWKICSFTCLTNPSSFFLAALIVVGRIFWFTFREKRSSFVSVRVRYTYGHTHSKARRYNLIQVAKVTSFVLYCNHNMEYGG